MALDGICRLLPLTSTDDQTTFFGSLGHRLLIGGDWNAKSTDWEHGLLHLKGEISSPPFPISIVSISARENLHTGRRTLTGCPTCWSSSLPEDFRILISRLCRSSSYPPTTRRLLDRLALISLTKRPLQHLLRPISTGICFELILMNM
jgi:hypothetical protein